MKAVLQNNSDFCVVLSIVFWLCVFNICEFTTNVHAIEKGSDKSYYRTAGQEPDTRYMLRLPPNRPTIPFFSSEEGKSLFVNNKCKYTNCFITDKKEYFSGEPGRDFDAVVFNGRRLKHLMPNDMPRKRLPYQKYIFAMLESPSNEPMKNIHLDSFFNWTWTYKTSSDIRWGYFTIYDLNGTVVGPKAEMHWIKHLEPINDALKYKLSRKTKAAAWFVSNCHSKNGREKFGHDLQYELKRYGLRADIYGRCGSMTCPRSNKQICDQKVEDEYYFYLAFENSFAEDYVTEKLLTALHNYAVPVVFGGADYSRYLPEGSYLDARKLGARKLAQEMDEIIRNKTKYNDFFRWRNHYVYKETTVNEDICSLCAALNDDERVRETIVWNNFRAWWNDNKQKQCRVHRPNATRKPKKIKLESLSNVPHICYPNKDTEYFGGFGASFH